MKAGLIYNRRHIYEDMIKRLELEMQLNSSTYKRNEETRVLDDIKALKKGIVDLENYETKKKAVEALEETYKTKFNERDQNWSEHKANKTRKIQMESELIQLTNEIKSISETITVNITTKSDLKKQLEDLNREISAKNQQIRKETRENKQISKQ
jgi:hypothetical protein